MASARTGGYCDKHKAICPAVTEESIDLFVCGFTCKLFSQESNARFKHAAVPEMFAPNGQVVPKAIPFVEASRFINKFRPATAVLENVTGCLKKVHAQIPDDAVYKTPLDYILNGVLRIDGKDEPIGFNGIQGYKTERFTLYGFQTLVSHRHVRDYILCFCEKMFCHEHPKLTSRSAQC